jgi:hypothetical protein
MKNLLGILLLTYCFQYFRRIIGQINEGVTARCSFLSESFSLLHQSLGDLQCHKLGKLLVIR